MAVWVGSKGFLLQTFPKIAARKGFQQRYLSSDVKKTFVAIPEIKDFICRCMTAVGTRDNHASELADVLVAADYRGHFSHGLNRLGEEYRNRYLIDSLVGADSGFSKGGGVWSGQGELGRPWEL